MPFSFEMYLGCIFTEGRIQSVLYEINFRLSESSRYVISAPKAFYVGASENVVIQVYGYRESFDVTIAIKSYPDKSFTYSFGQVNLSPENEFQNSANLIIKPEDLSGGPNAVSNVYLEVVSAHFSKASKIPLRYDTGFLFIQTDRSVYYSNEQVKVRVYSLDENLKPSQKEVILTFIDPEGSEVAVGEDRNATGIITFPDFKIPSHPKYGLWTIKANYKEDFTTIGTADFEIKRHGVYLEKPHFSLLVQPENYYISHENFEDFKITINARYSHNQNVTEAEVSVIFAIRNDLEDPRKEEMPEAIQKAQLINGIAQVSFNTSKAIKNLPYKSLQDLNNKYLNIFVKVQERTGRFFKGTKVMDVKYVLSPYTLHLVATPLSLKPGIPYSIKVQVRDVIGHVVGGNTVILKAKIVGATQESKDLDPMKSTTDHRGVASFMVDISPGVSALEFHISSKGKIVHFGTEKKLSGSSYQTLKLPVTQHMVPTAHLLVYYIITVEQTAELVSDSVFLNIEEKCGQQLQIRLSPDKEIHSPGEAVSLIMDTQSEMWVALTAVDSATYGIQRRSKNPLERVLGALDKSDQGCGASGGRSNAEVFYSAGLTVLTNTDVGHSLQNDESYKKILRPRRSLKEEIENLASQFRHPVIRKCCYDGAHGSEESCRERALRITVGQQCSKAFLKCCDLASELRANSSHIDITIARSDISPNILMMKTVLENWLWKVYHIPKRLQLELVPPDCVTTWEIQGVGISGKGLCVADGLQLQVYRDHFSVTSDGTTRVN
ncbi:complement C5-like isoform X3 [Marmota marmota marmota]|uniref:complement C5-like isoform X3 n=1 Tax=Marmota marmota marmota TaxID=9994 RepID=UPI0007627D9C|nr:complement C5-like isoform X3 [Marmota marmota marmota]